MSIKFSSKRPLTDHEEAEVQQMIADDPDDCDVSDQDARQKTTMDVAFPELAKKLRASTIGRPRVEHPKQQISIRLDPAVIEKFKATGKGWQGRINDVLARADV